MSAPHQPTTPAEPQPSPSPAGARAALEQGRIEAALAAAEAARLGTQVSRAMKALWMAFEQDLGERLLQAADEAQGRGDFGSGARWLGLLMRLDPEAAERAERSFARRLQLSAQDGAGGTLPPAASTQAPTPSPAEAASRPEERGSRPADPPLEHQPGPKSAGPPVPDPSRASPVRLGRVLADDLGELLLLSAAQLWLSASEAPGALPLKLPAAAPGAGLWLAQRPAARAGAMDNQGAFLGWRTGHGAAGDWQPTSVESGLALELGPQHRPWVRLQPRWRALEGSEDSGALSLAFERGVVAGQALGLVWLVGPCTFGASSACLLKAPSLPGEYRFELRGDQLELHGPGPVEARGPGAERARAAAAQAPGAPLLRMPLPFQERIEFVLGERRPAFWMRFEPWEDCL